MFPVVVSCQGAAVPFLPIQVEILYVMYTHAEEILDLLCSVLACYLRMLSHTLWQTFKYVNFIMN